MTLAELVRSMGTDLKPYIEIGKEDVFWVKHIPEGCSIQVDEQKMLKLSRDSRELLLDFRGKSFLYQLEAFLMTQIFGKGPKIFRPTNEQMFMLERMQLNIPVEEYNTPFETTVIELPKAYAESKGLPEQESPQVSVLYFKKEENLFIHDIMTNGQTALKSFWMSEDSKQELERWMSYDYHEDSQLQDLPTQEKEYAAEVQIRRAILNYCLLLDEVGVKQEGPACPSQYAQLVKWCQKSNKHTANNKLELIGQPILYSPSKETVLVRRVATTTELPESPSGRVTSPHSRRGHYRHYRNADGSLRLRVRIPCTIVNKHLLLGPSGGNYVT